MIVRGGGMVERNLFGQFFLPYETGPHEFLGFCFSDSERVGALPQCRSISG